MQERAKKVLRFAVTGALLGTASASASGCESLNRLINGEEPTATHGEPPQGFAPNPGPNELDPPQPEGPTVPELPHPNAAPVDPPPPSPEPNG